MIEWTEYLSYCHSIWLLLSASLNLRSLPTSSQNSLTDWLSDWQDQCSRTMFTRDQTRSHMTPVYIPLCLYTASQSMLGTATKRAGECDGNMCTEYILSQSNVSDPLTCRHNTVHKHTNTTHTQHLEARMHTREHLFMHTEQTIAVSAWFLKKNLNLFLCDFLCCKNSKIFVCRPILY